MCFCSSKINVLDYWVLPQTPLEMIYNIMLYAPYRLLKFLSILNFPIIECIPLSCNDLFGASLSLTCELLQCLMHIPSCGWDATCVLGMKNEWSLVFKGICYDVLSYN